MLMYSIHWKFIKITNQMFRARTSYYRTSFWYILQSCHFLFRSHHFKRLVRQVCDEPQPETGASEGHRRDCASAVPGERFQTHPHRGVEGQTSVSFSTCRITSCGRDHHVNRAVPLSGRFARLLRPLRGRREEPEAALPVQRSHPPSAGWRHWSSSDTQAMWVSGVGKKERERKSDFWFLHFIYDADIFLVYAAAHRIETET